MIIIYTYVNPGDLPGDNCGREEKDVAQADVIHYVS